MKHLFYLIGVAPILWEAMGVFDPLRFHKFSQSMKKLKGVKFDDYTKTQQYVSMLMLFYMVWIVAGFLSTQWVSFILIFLISLIPKPFVWIRFLDHLITFLLLVFIIINAYHLKIDLWAFIVTWFHNGKG